MLEAVIKITQSGADTQGPFNIFSDVDGFTSAFETNVSLNDLENGYFSNNVPLNTTVVRVVNISPNCNNFVDVVI